MLIEAIKLALEHGTHVFDGHGIISKDAATYSFDDGDFEPSYSPEDFIKYGTNLKALQQAALLGISKNQRLLRAAGPQRASVLSSIKGRKEALKTLRNTVFTKVEADWQNEEVEYQLNTLGYWLIQEPKRNLPFGCIETAMGFSKKDLAKREELLKTTLGYLLAGNWSVVNEYRAKKVGLFERKGYGALDVLPRQFGQYPHSINQPNCLGMSTMLCAWCELAGVEYMYVNTVRDASSTFAELLVSATEMSFDFCGEENIVIPEMYRFNMESDVESFRDPRTAKNFHHCVAIKLADEYWMMVDPYMNLLLPIEPINACTGDSIETTYRLLQSSKGVCDGLTITYDTSDYIAFRDDLENYTFDCFLSAIDAQFYSQEFADKPNMFFGAIHLLLQRDWFPCYWDTAYEQVGISGDHLLFPKNSRGVGRRTFRECMNGWVANAIFNATADYSFKNLSKLTSYYQANEDFAHRYREMFQVLPILQLMRKLRIGATEGKSKQNHFVVEFGNPYFQVACNTLNHLVAWDEEFSSLISPFEIAKFSGSQLVWHDAIVRWYNTQEPEQDSGWCTYLITQMQRLEKYQWHFQNRKLLTHPDDEKETLDENECRKESRQDQEAA